MHWEIGGYTPGDIEVVAAFDIDQRKVGKDVNEAIFAGSNCTTVFWRPTRKTNKPKKGSKHYRKIKLTQLFRFILRVRYKNRLMPQKP